jgi:hypothetical protein
MAITVWCPHPGCGQEFDVREAARGLDVPCPSCHRSVPIAAPSEPPPLPAYVAAPQPLAPQPLAPPPETTRVRPRARRRRLPASRRAFGRRPGAPARFGRDEPKSRHGCVTVWLILVILANTSLALVCIVAREQLLARFPAEISWLIPVTTVLAIANLICAVALLNWKLWGFVGMCLVAVASMGINLYFHAPVTDIAACVVGPVVLGILLQFGDRKSTWSQLE